MIFLQAQEPLSLQTEKTLSLIELIQNGGLGGQLIIGLLFILLLMLVYIYFERLFAIRSAVKVNPNFMPQIRSYVMNGKIDGAQKLCISENVPVSRLVSKGLSRIGRPLDDINKAIENAGRLEVYQLEKNISILATISGAEKEIKAATFCFHGDNENSVGILPALGIKLKNYGIEIG